jgi:hypothetical protein
MCQVAYLSVTWHMSRHEQPVLVNPCGLYEESARGRRGAPIHRAAQKAHSRQLISNILQEHARRPARMPCNGRIAWVRFDYM